MEEVIETEEFVWFGRDRRSEVVEWGRRGGITG